VQITQSKKSINWCS